MRQRMDVRGAVIGAVRLLGGRATAGEIVKAAAAGRDSLPFARAVGALIDRGALVRSWNLDGTEVTYGLPTAATRFDAALGCRVTV